MSGATQRSVELLVWCNIATTVAMVAFTITDGLADVEPPAVGVLQLASLAGISATVVAAALLAIRLSRDSQPRVRIVLRLSRWVVLPGAFVLVFLALWLAAAANADTFENLEERGVTTSARDAEARAVGRAGTEVRAVVDLPNGPTRVELFQDRAERQRLASDWTPAPAPYRGTFAVTYDPEDPTLVVAAADLDPARPRQDADASRPGFIWLACYSIPWAVAGVVAWFLNRRGSRRSR